ncbi:MAG: gamma-glutamyltransferase family protein [Acidobacteriia bacterium]|nr:gamma-glutamyltransferase family protein [Terriglobia bacterium]
MTEKGSYTPHSFVPTTLKPQVMGRRGVVVAGHPLVVEAGMRMLHQGGNAVDAGVATVFAAGVVEQASCGLGGEVPILIKLKGKPVVAVNGTGVAPELATASFYLNLPANDPRRGPFPVMIQGRNGIIPAYGPLSAIVPGMIDGLLVALEEFGTMSFSEVIEPAIELAQGFPADQRLAGTLQQHEPTYSKWKTSERVYKPKGKAVEQGAVWSQPELAKTLQAMADAEKKAKRRKRAAAIDAVRDYFYRGPIAKKIAKYCEEVGCLLRERDINSFRAQVERPLTTSYRGADVYKVSYWSQSPVFLQNLNLLEAFDLRSMGHNSPQYVHTVVEAMKLGYADRDAYYGDPHVSKIPAQLISKEYANVRRGLMNAKLASPDHRVGDPQRMKAEAPAEFAKARLRMRNAEHQDTTCVNVMDQDGNMFSATPSGAWIPAMMAADTGIPLTQRAQAFVLTPGHPNQIGPRKRPRITLTPTLALRNGKPWLAFSTPGGDSQDQTLLQVFLNVMEFGMQPQEAVEAPRFNSVAMYSSFDDHGDNPLGLQVESRFHESTLEELRALGHKLIMQGDWQNSSSPTMIEYDTRSRVIKAGADVRGHRWAAGW